MKILIAEDDKDGLALLMRAIKRQWKIDSIPLEIVGVSTLEGALAEADSANVTILDLNLADSDAEKTIAHIERFRPPVIVLTGYNDEGLAIRCMKAKAAHVFVKGEAVGFITAIFEAMQQDIVRRAEERANGTPT